MNAIGFTLLVIFSLVTLLGNRRQALIAMVCGVLYLSQSQQLSVFGFNLFAIRIIELAGFARVVMKREIVFSRLNGLDHVLLALYGYTTVVFILRSQEGSAAAIGNTVDALFCYFTFRGLIRSLPEFRWFLRAFVFVLAPYMVVLLIERKVGNVPFAFMAGSGGFSREGVPRCMGSFRSMDLLGTLGASFLPLYASLILAKVDRWHAAVGVAFCLGIVYLSNSGAPVGAAAFGTVAWGLWLIRDRMKLFRIGVVTALAALAVVMKAPIWYLMDRASSITGGAGWHRSYLIDVAYRHLGQWWLAGMPLSATQEWFPYTLRATGGADITNQYLVFGLDAGLVAMALLIALVAKAYSDLGKAMAVARRGGRRLRECELVLWGLGSMLTVHMLNWLAISYYDQFYVIWFLHLALIRTLSGNLIAWGQRQTRLAPPPLGPVSTPPAAGFPTPAHAGETQLNT